MTEPKIPKELRMRLDLIGNAERRAECIRTRRADLVAEIEKGVADVKEKIVDDLDNDRAPISQVREKLNKLEDLL